MRPDSFIEEVPGQQHAIYNYQSRGPMHRQPNGYGPSFHNQVAETTSPSHSHQQSYETMTSGSDETPSKSTNPSSQNSSFDRLHQLRKPEEGLSEYDMAFAPMNAPQPTGFMYNPNDSQAQRSDYGGPQVGYGYPQQMSRGPALPPTQANMPNNPRIPIRLNSGSGAPPPEGDYGLKQSPSTKRQSWIKRRFSRRNS